MMRLQPETGYEYHVFREHNDQDILVASFRTYLLANQAAVDLGDDHFVEGPEERKAWEINK